MLLLTVTDGREQNQRERPRNYYKFFVEQGELRWWNSSTTLNRHWSLLLTHRCSSSRGRSAPRQGHTAPPMVHTHHGPPTWFHRSSSSLTTSSRTEARVWSAPELICMLQRLPAIRTVSAIYHQSCLLLFVCCEYWRVHKPPSICSYYSFCCCCCCLQRRYSFRVWTAPHSGQMGLQQSKSLHWETPSY